MELRQLVIRVRTSTFGRKKRRGIIFFCITPEEALKVREFCQERPDIAKLMIDRDISHEQLERLEASRFAMRAETLVLSGPARSSVRLAELACLAHLRGARIRNLEETLLDLSPRVPASSDPIVRLLTDVAVRQGFANRGYIAAKSVIEPFVAWMMIILLAPILALVALAIRMTSPGPIFYRQTRLGRNGREFEIVKFRSMRIDAEKDGPVWASASKNDSRMTPIGEFLRATHLDELPQLFNVAQGDLSFVGPRPERPFFTEKLQKEIELFHLRTLVKPGITGWAQVRGGYANSVEDSRIKLEHDLYYILKHSFLMDLQIVLETVLTLVSGGTEGKKRRQVKGRNRKKIAGYGASGVQPVGRNWRRA